MGKVVSLNSLSKDRLKKPSRPETEDAVRTLTGWAGDDPDREGLKGTPGRVVCT
jgi:GTP cyclohydrolase I